MYSLTHRAFLPGMVTKLLFYSYKSQLKFLPQILAIKELPEHIWSDNHFQGCVWHVFSMISGADTFQT